MQFTTVKDLRRTLRAMNGERLDEITVDGWGRIKKIGTGRAPYALGPLPEDDDSDPYTDYSAWSYCNTESDIIRYLQDDLHLQ